MNRTYLDYLNRILDSMRNAQQFVEGIDYDTFVQDDRTNFAVITAIEIAGEATKHIPGEVQTRLPEVHWRRMARMRDDLIHDYYSVDLQVVWDTVTANFPQTIPALRSCLEVLQAEETEGLERS